MYHQRGKVARPGPRRFSDWRMTDGLDDAGEAIAEKLIKKLSGGDAARALSCVEVPLVEAYNAELSDVTLHGLDRFRLQPGFPPRVLQSEKRLLIWIPLQAKDLTVTGKYTTLRAHANMKGTFKARLQHINLCAEITISHNDPKLEALEVVKMQGFKVKSAAGMTVFMNWVLLTMIDIFVYRNQARLFQLIREATWEAFVTHVMNVLPYIDVRYSNRKPTGRNEDKK